MIKTNYRSQASAAAGNPIESLKRQLKKFFLLPVVILMALPATMVGQSAEEQFGQGVAALQRGENEEAAKIFGNVISNFAAAAENFGPRFGVIYFHRGLAYMNLERYEDAVKDFVICFEKFANEPGNDSVNPYHTASLLQIGGCYMRLEEFEKAIEYMQKFEETMQGDPIDKDRVTYNRGALWSNLAIALAKIGKPELAEEYYGKIIIDDGENDRQTRSTFSLFASIPQDIVIEILEAYSEVEDSVVKIHAFFDKYENVIRRDPALRYRHAPRYILLGQQYGAEESYALARRFYALVPTPSEVSEDLRFKKYSPDARPDTAGTPSVLGRILERVEVTLQEELNGPTPYEGYIIMGLARMFQENGNFQATFAGFGYLSDTYPQAELRPQFLHGTIQSASVIGRLDAIDKYAQIFIEEFPDHELKPAVEALWMEGMFLNEDYVNALRVARERLPHIPEGTEQRDLAEYIIGASLYFLEQYAEAEPKLRAHVNTYPESANKEMVRFVMADNLFRLNRFTEAGTLLDAFIAEFPSSAMMDQALYTRADIHYNLDQLDEAVNKLNTFFVNYGASPWSDRAHNLFGNVYQARGDEEDADTQYKLGLERARQFSNIDVLTDSLVFLIALHKENEEKTEEVLGYYDLFFENYPNHPNKPRIAVEAMPALERAGRLDEGLDRLKVIIADFGSSPEAFGLDDTVLTFAAYARKQGMPLDEMRELFYNFPGVPGEALVVRARLRMTLIDIFEEEKEQAETPAARAQLEGRISAVFTQLNEDFAPGDLSNYILIRIGENLRERGRFEQAERYLEELLSRPDTAYRENALYALAQIGLESGDPDRLRAAVDALEMLLDDYAGDRALAERSTRLLALVYEELGDWPKVNETWAAYLKNPGWRAFAAEGYYRTARAYEKREMWGDALANYAQVRGVYISYVEYSAPAWLRISEIQFDVLNKKQEGYDSLWAMIDRIGHLEDDDPTGKITEAKLKLGQWERAPGVTRRP